MAEGLICYSCKKHKYELTKVKSKLMPDSYLYLCKDCVLNKREPRGWIVLAGREGVNIDYWIKNHRYVGEAITVRELM